MQERLATANIIVTDSYMPPCTSHSQYRGIFPIIPSSSAIHNIMSKSPIFAKEVDTESNEGTLRSIEQAMND